MAKAELIDGYKRAPYLLEHERPEANEESFKKKEGFNPFTLKIKKITKVPHDTLEDRCDKVFDSITAALEAGVLERFGWPTQMFATRSAFKEFLEAVESYDETFRIVDRWYFSFMELADVRDEEGFISGQEIAEKLEEFANEKCKDWK